MKQKKLSEYVNGRMKRLLILFIVIPMISTGQVVVLKRDFIKVADKVKNLEGDFLHKHNAFYLVLENGEVFETPINIYGMYSRGDYALIMTKEKTYKDGRKRKFRDMLWKSPKEVLRRKNQLR